MPRRRSEDTGEIADRLGTPVEMRAVVAALQRFRAATTVQSMDLWLQLDLTMPQFAALYTIWRRGPLSGRQLAEQLAISAPAVVKVCDRLEARGLLARVRDQSDRRVQWLKLTASGADVFTRFVATTREHMLPALNRLSARDRASLTRILNGLAESIEAGFKSADGDSESFAVQSTLVDGRSNRRTGGRGGGGRGRAKVG
jgi:DNA-binding MarR family transcriptional regulator